MIQGIALGVGIGLTAYGCMKFLLGKVYTEEQLTSIESDEPIRQEEAQRTEVSPVVVAESSQDLVSDIAAFCKQREVSEIPEVHGAIIDAEEVALRSEIPEPNDAVEFKSWYVIRTSKGLLRTCRCSSQTSHTVAGPFPTKLAARQAKEQYGGAEA